MAPDPSFYIVYNLIYLLFIINTSLVTFAFFLFHHTINHFVFCETGEIDNLSAVGDKVFGWVCAGPCLLKVSLSARDLQYSPRCWFQSPTGSINLVSIKEGKLLLDTIPPSLGAPPNSSPSPIKQFSGVVAGEFGVAARGVSYSQSLYFVFVLLALFLV